MKKIISIIISIAMCAMLASCGGVKNEVSDTEQPTLIDTMSLEEKVGQILFVRCVGSKVPPYTPIFIEIPPQTDHCEFISPDQIYLY